MKSGANVSVFHHVIIGVWKWLGRETQEIKVAVTSWYQNSLKHAVSSFVGLFSLWEISIVYPQTAGILHHPQLCSYNLII